MTQMSTAGPKPGLTAAPPPAALRPASAAALAPASASFRRSQARRHEPRGIDGFLSCACASGPGPVFTRLRAIRAIVRSCP